MSHNHDESSYEEDRFEERSGHDYGRREPYISTQFNGKRISTTLGQLNNSEDTTSIVELVDEDEDGREKEGEKGDMMPHGVMLVPLNSSRDQERHHDNEKTPPYRSICGYGWIMEVADKEDSIWDLQERYFVRRKFMKTQRTQCPPFCDRPRLYGGAHHILP
ncbi:hypothetical protein AgCh_027389 [Apium graveolens]